MPRKSARLGAPYVGNVCCPDCKEITPIVALEGAELPDDPLERVLVDCPECDGIEAYLL
jgi:hypothetical protein